MLELVASRKGHYSINHTHVVNQVIEKFFYYIAFKDYTWAFDSADASAVSCNPGVDETHVDTLM